MSKPGGGGFWDRFFGRKQTAVSESKVAVRPATPPKPAEENLYDNIDILEKSAVNAPPPPASPSCKEVRKDTGASSKEVRKDKAPSPAAKKPEPAKPAAEPAKPAADAAKPTTPPAGAAKSKAPEPSKLTPATVPNGTGKSKEPINQQTVQISLQQDTSAAPQSVGQEIVTKDPNIVTNYRSAPIASAISAPQAPIRQKLSAPSTSSACKSTS